MDKPKSQHRRAGEVTAAWWRDLHPDPDRAHNGDRAALARLRRMGSVPEALTDPAVIALIRNVAQATGWSLLPTAWWVSPATITAVTLAHIRHNGRVPIAEALGQELSVDRPRYSGLRFTRLIRAVSDEDRLTQLGRAARRLSADDVPINVARFATDVFRLWSYPDDVYRDWTFQYHQMATSAPGSDADAGATA